MSVRVFLSPEANQFSRVGNQPQSTGGHRCSTEAPPVDHCSGIRRFCGGHRCTTGGGTHSPTGGPPEIPPVVTDCSTDGTRMMQVQQKSAEVQQNYSARIKKAQISRKPWDSNLLLNTIEIYIWIH